MQTAMEADGKERGVMGALSLSRDENGKLSSALLSFGRIITGDKDKIGFIFSGFSPAKDSYGNLSILTIHTHKHNGGLSGDPSRVDEMPGQGDYGNVSSSGIPWFTIGPQKSHVSYINRYGRQESSEYKGKNYLLDALKLIR